MRPASSQTTTVTEDRARNGGTSTPAGHSVWDVEPIFPDAESDAEVAAVPVGEDALRDALAPTRYPAASRGTDAAVREHAGVGPVRHGPVASCATEGRGTEDRDVGRARRRRRDRGVGVVLPWGR